MYSIAICLKLIYPGVLYVSGKPFFLMYLKKCYALKLYPSVTFFERLCNKKCTVTLESKKKTEIF